MKFGSGTAATPYVKQLRRRRRAARRWTIFAGLYGGAAAVLLPYQGIGPWDAIWAGLFGASAVMTVFRWIDYRQLAKTTPPEPVQLAPQGAAALFAEAQTVAGELAGKVRTKRTTAQFRRSAAGPAFARLEQAALALDNLAPRLSGPASQTMDDVHQSQGMLRDLAERIRSVEKSMSVTPPHRRASLEAAHQLMVDRLDAGVGAYEDMVGAAAQVLAEQSALDGVVGSNDLTLTRLTEASEKLHGLAEGIGQMREFHTPPDVA